MGLCIMHCVHNVSRWTITTDLLTKVWTFCDTILVLLVPKQLCTSFYLCTTHFLPHEYFSSMAESKWPAEGKHYRACSLLCCICCMEKSSSIVVECTTVIRALVGQVNVLDRSWFGWSTGPRAETLVNFSWKFWIYRVFVRKNVSSLVSEQCHAARSWTYLIAMQTWRAGN